MLKLNCKYATAYEYVKSKRKQGGPNKGFVKQLKKFEEIVDEYWRVKDTKFAENGFENMDQFSDLDLINGKIYE